MQSEGGAAQGLWSPEAGKGQAQSPLGLHISLHVSPHTHSDVCTYVHACACPLRPRSAQSQLAPFSTSPHGGL